MVDPSPTPVQYNNAKTSLCTWVSMGCTRRKNPRTSDDTSSPKSKSSVELLMFTVETASANIEK